jgi:hypothetical protein
MKKTVKRVRSGAAPQVMSKSRKPLAKRVSAKPDFIGRLKGIIRIVGDIESPIEPEAWECSDARDLKQINRAARRLNSEATDVLDYYVKSR